ncbi:hypothetical protein SAMN04489841_1567 [Natrinema salaciae]|uniref:Uncharacterized protein n=1 Tax=Natrinema salaciae TaxID=1186196 RepID=A0A1H9FF83_9EURY|nr:hypothetical protein SAMN04489841_1567 [Natrinema salaciae]
MGEYSQKVVFPDRIWGEYLEHNCRQRLSILVRYRRPMTDVFAIDWMTFG